VEPSKHRARLRSTQAYRSYPPGTGSLSLRSCQRQLKTDQLSAGVYLANGVSGGVHQ
jgi:hypothetical protein